jgi:predicted small secreted protein
MEREMFLIGLPIAFVLFLITMFYAEKRRQRERAIALVKEHPEVKEWHETFGGWFEMEPLRFPEIKVVAHKGDVVVVRVFELVLDSGVKNDFGFYEVNLVTAEIICRVQDK